MRLHLLCVSRRPAAWVSAATDEYLKRLHGKLDFQCREFAPPHAANAEQQRTREAELVLKAVPAGALLCALDARGEAWSTTDLAGRLERWPQTYKDAVFVIGGAEGLAPTLRAAAACIWSLSRLTLPHQLARVIVVEQIYRAWSLLHHHPYHRA
jgi:23S rRNA (pseudouridine1915-N3)-methyltransferase